MSEKMTFKIDQLSVKHLGTLEDFGLGNPGQIGHDLNPEELKSNIEKLKNCITEKTDLTCLMCIDGRECLGTNLTSGYVDLDLSQRGALTGGGLSLSVSELLSNSSVFQEFNQEMNGASVEDLFHAIEARYAASDVGYVPSSHTGGCAAANLLAEHMQQLSDNPAIVSAAGALINEISPSMLSAYGIVGDIQANQLRINAGILAQNLKTSAWTGTKYTEYTAEKGVIDELAAADDKFHGHKEKMIVVKFGNRSLTLDRKKLITEFGTEVFLLDADDADYYARAMKKSNGDSNYDRSIGAFMSHGLAAANGIIDPKMPVVVINLTQTA